MTAFPLLVAFLANQALVSIPPRVAVWPQPSAAIH